MTEGNGYTDETPRAPDNHPRDRVTDQDWRGRVKHWWGPGRGYRDVWLLAVTGIVLIAVALSWSASEKAKDNSAEAKAQAERNEELLAEIQRSRGDSIREACQTDEILADAMRIILNDALKRSDDPARAEDLRRFYDEVLEPLGGLRPITQELQNQRCDQRVARGGTESPP